MYEQRVLGLAHRMAARIGAKWQAQPYPVGAQITGPNGARIVIEAICDDALQITLKPPNALDTTYSFTAPLVWGSDKIIEVMIRDYLPEYRKLLADRMELRHGAQAWAEDTQDALERIGQTLSAPPRVMTEGHDGEPHCVYGYFNVGEAGEVAVEAAHLGDINVRLKTRDIEVLRVLIPVLATYNKPAAHGEFVQIALETETAPVSV